MVIAQLVPTDLGNEKVLSKLSNALKVLVSEHSKKQTDVANKVSECGRETGSDRSIQI